MNLKFEDEVELDLEDIEDKVNKEIMSAIFDLEENPLPENSSVIRLFDGSQVQCLKLQKDDRNSALNHRVTYDIRGEEIRIYGIFPRDPGYEDIKSETEERK
jgi:hypothetical protein